jgi:hypothetical protein
MAMPPVADWIELFEPLMKAIFAGAMARQMPALRAGIGLRTGGGNRFPVRRSVAKDDIASELAESSSTTDPESLRDPRLFSCF